MCSFEWLVYLRKSHPTIPFKCNTQQQKGNLSIGSGKVTKTDGNALQNNKTIGAEELLNCSRTTAASATPSPSSPWASWASPMSARVPL